MCQCDSPLVSILILTRNRVGPLTRCLESVSRQRYESIEIVVLDDASTEAIGPLLAPHFGSVRFVRSESRMGVAGGRNCLVRESRGKLLVFIDDDAVLAERQALDRVVAYFQNEQTVGTLAFQIVDSTNGGAKPRGPFPRLARAWTPSLMKRPGYVSYYSGCGHAMRREVFDQCGPYRQDLIFGGEEFEIAYRQIEAGFLIKYVPDVVVHHFPDTSVVQTVESSRSELYYGLRNRIWIGYEFLPWRYFFVYTGSWCLRVFAESIIRGRLREFWGGFWAGWRRLKHMNRRPLSNRSITYVRGHHGRLLH